VLVLYRSMRPPRHRTPAGSDGSESPYFQWGLRSASTCTSAFLSLGFNPTWGAGGFFNCDIYYSQGPSTVQGEPRRGADWRALRCSVGHP
jgi:hypothetical protein